MSEPSAKVSRETYSNNCPSLLSIISTFIENKNWGGDLK
jgi:hypothetical protein